MDKDTKINIGAFVIFITMIVVILAGTLSIAGAVKELTRSFNAHEDYDNRMECHYQIQDYRNNRDNTPSEECLKHIEQAFKNFQRSELSAHYQTI